MDDSTHGSKIGYDDTGKAPAPPAMVCLTCGLTKGTRRPDPESHWAMGKCSLCGRVNAVSAGRGFGLIEKCPTCYATASPPCACAQAPHGQALSLALKT